MDAGAKDSLDYIQPLESCTELHAFEPDPLEIRILESKYVAGNFKHLKLNQSALSDFSGEADFYKTNHTSMSSLLKADIENYEKHFGFYKEFNKWKNSISEQESFKVGVVTLDEYIGDENIIDYLKLDTQGNELSILKGAESLLTGKRINVIRVEVSTVPVYKDQAVFSEIDTYLRYFGYELVDFKTFRNNYQPVFSKGNREAHYAPCGDAVYVMNHKFLSNENKMKSAIILLWLEYASLAKSYLLHSQITEEEIMALMKFRLRKRNHLKQLIVNLTPPIIIYWLKKLLR